MTSYLKPLAITALLSALAACGSDKSSNNIFATLVAAIKARPAADAGRAKVTRADVAGFPNALILASLDARGEALLGVSASTGAYKTWRSAGGVSFTLRRGVLVSTRGLGEDLMSSDVPDIKSVRGKTAHVSYYLDGLEITRPRAYTCTVTAAGSETVVVLGKRYPVQRLVETCQSGDTHIQNIFWIGTDQTIRKSRQFVSNSVGYVTLQRVID